MMSAFCNEFMAATIEHAKQNPMAPYAAMVVYGSTIPFLQGLFGRQIQLRAEDLLSKTPEGYHCQLIGGVMEAECNQLFILAHQLKGKVIL